MKLFSVVSGLLLSCCAAPISGQTVGDIVANTTELSTLYLAAETAGFVDGLGTTEMTLFAPTNEAFDAVDPAVLALLLTPPWLIHLQALLSQHVVLGTVLSSNITDGDSVDSQAANFSPLPDMGAITFTLNEDGVFASGLAFSDSQVIGPDVIADNGVVHIVDEVFIPLVIAQTLWQGFEALPEGFEIFKGFALGTGVDIILNGADPITAFPVPDDVIAAIPEADLEGVNMTEILLNHIVMGVLPSTSVTDGMEVQTLAGNTLTINIAVDGTVLVGNATVIQPNFLGSNGIAHILGSVLIPGVDLTAPPVTAPTQAPVVPPTMAPGAPGATTEMPTAAGSGASTASVLLSFVAIAAAMLW